jgi:hypothetical protein
MAVAIVPMGDMLDHERLDVYQVALEFLVVANEMIERLPRGRSHLADQRTRASTSVVLNLAEGAGKHSKPDKRRFYFTARFRDGVGRSARCLSSSAAARGSEPSSQQRGRTTHPWSTIRSSWKTYRLRFRVRARARARLRSAEYGDRP